MGARRFPGTPLGCKPCCVYGGRANSPARQSVPPPPRRTARHNGRRLLGTAARPNARRKAGLNGTALPGRSHSGRRDRAYNAFGKPHGRGAPPPPMACLHGAHTGPDTAERGAASIRGVTRGRDFKMTACDESGRGTRWRAPRSKTGTQRSEPAPPARVAAASSTLKSTAVKPTGASAPGPGSRGYALEAPAGAATAQAPAAPSPRAQAWLAGPTRAAAPAG
jgi:hypothetical protein